MRIGWGIGGVLAVVMLLMLATTHTNRANIVGSYRTANATPRHPKPNLDAVVKLNIASHYGRLPLSFEPNLGQRDSQVKFISRGDGYALSLMPTAATLTLRAHEAANRMHRHQSELASRPARITTQMLRLELLGAEANAQIDGVDRLPGTVNYFIGKDSRKWRTHIPAYARVRYHNIYPGIDLVYYGTDQHQLEYDFIVRPGANPSSIALRFHGAQRLRLDSIGDLHAQLADGGEVIHHAPKVYQERRGDRQRVGGKWVLQGIDRVRFALEDYDRSRAVYIDPTLTYSTYLGGSGDDAGDGDSGAAIAVDASGDAYVIGTSFSSDFPIGGAAPASAGPADGTNFPSVFIAKLNSSGTALLWTAVVVAVVGVTGGLIAWRRRNRIPSSL